MSSKLLWGLLAVFLAACQPLPTPASLPTPEPVRVQVTVAAAALRQDLHTCAEKIPEMGLTVAEVPTAALDLSQADLSLRLGAPDGLEAAAYPVGKETVQVVVHPDNPIREIDAAGLAAIFQGRITAWDQVAGAQDLPSGLPTSPIQVWTYLPGEDLRTQFEATVLDGLSPGPSVQIAPGPEAMRQAVAENPGAIGFLPAAWLDDTVRPVDLSADLQTRLTLDVLALAPREPQGLPRRLLECLQSAP